MSIRCRSEEVDGEEEGQPFQFISSRMLVGKRVAVIVGRKHAGSDGGDGSTTRASNVSMVCPHLIPVYMPVCVCVCFGQLISHWR